MKTIILVKSSRNGKVAKFPNISKACEHYGVHRGAINQKLLKARKGEFILHAKDGVRKNTLFFAWDFLK